MNFTNETLLHCYEDMLLLRRFEEKAAQLYGMGMILGFCHLYIGQEAIAVGIKHSINKGDVVITGYRSHGFALTSGIDPKAVMSELLGKSSGCSKGKGGSMHMFNTKGGFYGGHGIVGSQVSLGTGIAFGMQYKNQNNISITVFGDGATNQGQVYESFNMAKLWNLPVIYVIENNEYGLSTAIHRATSNTNLYNRGLPFDIPGERVNGMNIIAVMDAMNKACEYVRNGNGPMIIEMKTYRYKGHSMSDPAQYRTKDELEEYKKQDPILNLKDYLLKERSIKVETLKEIEKNVQARIKKEIEEAQNGPVPNSAELFTDIYA